MEAATGRRNGGTSGGQGPVELHSTAPPAEGQGEPGEVQETEQAQLHTGAATAKGRGRRGGGGQWLAATGRSYTQLCFV